MCLKRFWNNIGVLYFVRGAVYTVASFLFPFVVLAQVEITEIMYDVPGADKGYEWVEIYNAGDTSVDVSGWWFFDGSGNHGFQNNAPVSLAPGAYAVIVDDPTKFNEMFGGVSALVLDSSSFSLKNTGEMIAIRDDEKNDIDTVSYSPLPEASGSGLSLQKINGIWQAAAPTLGSGNTTFGNTSPAKKEGERVSASRESSGTQTTAPEPLSHSVSGAGTVAYEKLPRMTAAIAPLPDVLVAGALVRFEGTLFGLKGDPITNGGRFVWSFGDGGTGRGRVVSYTFKYPGTYAVVLTASSGEYSASARVDIKVVPASVAISAIGTREDSFVEIENMSDVDLDLSGWKFRAGGVVFTIPERTIILPNTKTRFAKEYTRFSLGKNSRVELFYPNGKLAAEYPTPNTLQNVSQRNPLPSSGAVSGSLSMVSEKQQQNQTTAPRAQRKRNASKQQLSSSYASSGGAAGIDATDMREVNYDNTSLSASSTGQASVIVGTADDGGLMRWIVAAGAFAALAIVASIAFLRTGEDEVAASYEIVEEGE